MLSEILFHIFMISAIKNRIGYMLFGWVMNGGYDGGRFRIELSKG